MSESPNSTNPPGKAVIARKSAPQASSRNGHEALLRAGVVAPPGLRFSCFDVGSEQYAILSHPLPRWELPATLTRAEREVVRAVLEGVDRDEIARTRKNSPRTVANLLAQAFRKLGVHCRIELAARLAGEPKRSSTQG